jgi:hypothetical protein
MSRLLSGFNALVTLGSAIKEYFGHTRIGRYLERRARPIKRSLLRRLRWVDPTHIAAAAHLRRGLSSFGRALAPALLLLLFFAPILAAVAWIVVRWIDFPLALAMATAFYLHAFRQLVFSVGLGARIARAGRIARRFLYVAMWVLTPLFLYLLLTSSIVDIDGSGQPDLLRRSAIGVLFVLLVVIGDAIRSRESPSEVQNELIGRARWMTNYVAILSFVQAALSVWQLVFALQTFGLAEPEGDELTRMFAFERTAAQLPPAERDRLQQAENERLVARISWAAFSIPIVLVMKIKGRLQLELAELEAGFDEPYKVVIEEKGASRFYRRFAGISLVLVIVDVFVSNWLKQRFAGSVVLAILGLVALGLDLHKWYLTRYEIKAVASG